MSTTDKEGQKMDQKTPVEFHENVNPGDVRKWRFFSKQGKVLASAIFLIIVGVVLVRIFAATNYTDPPVTKQDLIDDITLKHDTPGNLFPYMNFGLSGYGQTYAQTSGLSPWQKPAGSFNLSGMTDGGIHPWFELSTIKDSPTDVNAVVEMKTVGLAVYRKDKNAWDTVYPLPNHPISWHSTIAQINDYNGQSGQQGRLDPLTKSADGNQLIGFGIGSFGQNRSGFVPDVGTERIRSHGSFAQEWEAGQYYICGGKISWGSSCNSADSAVTNNVTAAVEWVTVKVSPRTGTSTADLDRAQYVIMPGFDKAVGPASPGSWEGIFGRARRITKDWNTFTMSTMSTTQLNTLPPPPIPGYGSTTTPPTPPQPPTPTNQQPTITSFTSSTASAVAPASFTVNATAADPDGSIGTLEIFQNTSTTPISTCKGVASCSTSLTNIAAGNYSYVVRATDNLGAVTTSSTIYVSVTASPVTYLPNGTYNDDQAAYSASGWTAATGGDTYLQNEHYSNTAGSTATIKFNGGQLQLVSHRNYDMGKATVTIDGVKQTSDADWYAASYATPSINGTYSLPTKGNHTAVISVSSGYVSIDKFIVADAPVVVNPQPATGGLTGQYFNKENDWSGTPTMTRTDEAINQLWPVDGGPGGGIGTDNFSVKWTGKVYAPTDGSYTFSTWSDDGVQVTVNGVVVIDNLTWHAPTKNIASKTLQLTKGVANTIEVKYFEGGGGATMQLMWAAPGMSEQAIPASAFKASTSSLAPGLVAQFFNNKTLTDPIALSRIDNQATPVNYNLQTASPATGVNADNYSARWTGKVAVPTSGTYTFHTVSDDGVRLWVNGQQLVNNWTDHGTTDNKGTIKLDPGTAYDIKLEYYEYGGWSTMQLKWSGPGIADQLIPVSALSH